MPNRISAKVMTLTKSVVAVSEVSHWVTRGSGWSDTALFFEIQTSAGEGGLH